MNLFALTLLGISIGYLSFTPIRVPAKYLSWFNEHFNLVDNTLVITRETFNRLQIFHYTLLSSLLILIMQCYGNCSERLFPALGMLSFPIFGFLGQVKGMQFSVTPNFWHGLSPIAKRTLVGLLLFFSLFISYQFYLAWLANEVLKYSILVTGVPLLYWAVFKFYLIIGDTNWHIHHWFIGYYGALVSRYDSILSNFVFAVLWGVFLEGVMTYGIIPIIHANSEHCRSENPKKTGSNLNLAQLVEREGWGKISKLDQFSITCGNMHIIWPMYKYCKSETENQYIKGFYDALCGKMWTNKDSPDYIRGNLDFYNKEYQCLITPDSITSSNNLLDHPHKLPPDVL